jgi:hypothetical protein
MRRRFGPLLIGLVSIGLLASGWAGCVVRRQSDTCERQSDCSTGRFCTGRGFCESECGGAGDCPCGSFCAASCGICVREDLRGPATCIAYQRGLSTNEVLGACGTDIATRAADAADAAGESEGGACNPPPTLPECTQSPPLDATADSSSEDARDAGDAETTDAEDDAANDSSITDAQSNETGGDQ